MAQAFYGELELEVLETVYVPAEDSFLLADSLEFSRGKSFLDLGCGSGLLGVLAGKAGMRVTFADLNPKALENARVNAQKVGIVGAVFVQGDLFSGVEGQKFDVVSFNPPYVPGKRNAVELDGGKKGRETMDRFLEALPAHLAPAGKAFLLQSSLNGEAVTREKVKALGLFGDVVVRKHLFFEELLVWKLSFPENRNFVKR